MLSVSGRLRIRITGTDNSVATRSLRGGGGLKIEAVTLTRMEEMQKGRAITEEGELFKFEG